MKNVLLLFLTLNLFAQESIDYGKRFFVEISKNKDQKILKSIIDESKISELKFNDGVSELEKNNFIKTLTGKTVNLKTNLQNDLNQIKLEKNLQKSKYLFTEYDLFKLRNIDVSVGKLKIHFLRGEIEKILLIDVLKLNEEYLLIGRIIIIENNIKQ